MGLKKIGEKKLPQIFDAEIFRGAVVVAVSLRTA
jgi:hypothetical protein